MIGYITKHAKGGLVQPFDCDDFPAASRIAWQEWIGYNANRTVASFHSTACARRGASRKRSTAMRRLIMVSLIALAVVLLLASDAR